MKRNIGSVDGLTRALGGVPLLFGSVFVLPGIDWKTAETLVLWVALLVGMGSLIAAFSGKCSWYAGVLIGGTAYVLLSVRFVPSVPVQLVAGLAGIVVGAGALFTRATGHCPVNAALKIHST